MLHNHKASRPPLHPSASSASLCGGKSWRTWRLLCVPCVGKPLRSFAFGKPLRSSASSASPAVKNLGTHGGFSASLALGNLCVPLRSSASSAVKNLGERGGFSASLALGNLCVPLLWEASASLCVLCGKSARNTDKVSSAPLPHVVNSLSGNDSRPSDRCGRLYY